MYMTSVELLQGIAVGAFGGLVGLGELISRYRSAPGEAMKVPAFWFYILINIAASVSAFAVIKLQGWSFGTAGTISGALAQMLVSGFGALALFRSSLFTVQAGADSIPIGPLSFLQVVLQAADSQVDRALAKDRSADVTRFMSGVSFVKAKDALPAYCIALMQDVSEADQTLLGQNVKALDGSSADDKMKALILGLLLINIVGDNVLEQAVADLRPSIAA
jgi:hypothetical protein